MGLEPGPGRDGIVIADDQHAMVRVGTQRVDSRVEGVASVQPPDPRLMAIRAAANAHVRAQERRRAHGDSSFNDLSVQVQSCGKVTGEVKILSIYESYIEKILT
jgi:hypothetical protein